MKCRAKMRTKPISYRRAMMSSVDAELIIVWIDIEFCCLRLRNVASCTYTLIFIVEQQPLYPLIIDKAASVESLIICIATTGLPPTSLVRDHAWHQDKESQDILSVLIYLIITCLVHYLFISFPVYCLHSRLDFIK